MSGRYSEIQVYNGAGELQVLKLVFTLAALAAIEKVVGKPLTHTFQDIGAEGFLAVLFHATRDAHPDLSEADIAKFSRLPLVQIAEAYNRDIGALGESKAATATVATPEPPTKTAA